MLSENDIDLRYMESRSQELVHYVSNGLISICFGNKFRYSGRTFHHINVHKKADKHLFSYLACWSFMHSVPCISTVNLTNEFVQSFSNEHSGVSSSTQTTRISSRKIWKYVSLLGVNEMSVPRIFIVYPLGNGARVWG